MYESKTNILSDYEPKAITLANVVSKVFLFRKENNWINRKKNSYFSSYTFNALPEGSSVWSDHFGSHIGMSSL